MKKSLIIIIILILIFMIAIGSTAYKTYEEVVNIDSIYPGITVGGKDVYGLNREQAIEKLNIDFYNETSNKNLIMRAKEYQVEVTPEDLGFRWNIDEAVEQAYAIGRRGNPLERYKKIKEVEAGVNIPVELLYDKSRIDDIVRNTGLVVNKDPEEGEFEFIDGRIIAHDGKPGYKVNEDFVRTELTNYAETLYSLKEPKIVELLVDEVKPEKSTAYERINGVIGQFSTSLKGSSENRIYNVRHSLEAVSGKMLNPGESLSFNEKTGPRSVRNGYRDASVIINGKYEDGTGGGVCQTSTTLYNALIRANVTIDERHNHSIPASYVPYGLDAAVNDSNMDLKFTNNYDFPIFIYGEVEGIVVTFTIYGDTNAVKNQYKFDSVVSQREEPEVIETLDPTMEINSKELLKQGYPGLHVISYRYEYDKDGKLIEKTILNKDYYKKINFEYKVGEKVEVPVMPEIPRETNFNGNAVEVPAEEPPVENFPFVDPNDENNNGNLDGDGY